MNRADPPNQDDPMDERDPLLSRAYREADQPHPPAALDARILAAARAEVAAPARPSRTRGWRWAVPFSTTAVLVLAVTLLLKVQDEAPERLRDVAPPPPSPASAGPGWPTPAQPPAGEAPRARQEPASSPARDDGEGLPAPFPGRKAGPAASTSQAAAPAASGPLSSTPAVSPSIPAPAGAGRGAPPAGQDEMAPSRSASETADPANLPAPSPALQSRAATRPETGGEAVSSKPALAASASAASGSGPPAAESPPAPPSARRPAPANAAASPPARTQERLTPRRETDDASAKTSGAAEQEAGEPVHRSRSSSPEGTTPAAGPATPQALVEEIRRLLRQGRRQEAIRLLEVARRRYPDYTFPPEVAELGMGR